MIYCKKKQGNVQNDAAKSSKNEFNQVDKYVALPHCTA